MAEKIMPATRLPESAMAMTTRPRPEEISAGLRLRHIAVLLVIMARRLLGPEDVTMMTIGREAPRLLALALLGLVPLLDTPLLLHSLPMSTPPEAAMVHLLVGIRMSGMIDALRRVNGIPDTHLLVVASVQDLHLVDHHLASGMSMKGLLPLGASSCRRRR
jgi:hypothetical protein